MGATFQITVLYTISFLDTLCFGLIMPVLPPYILILGGNHTVLGILGMLHMLLQLLSVPLGQVYSEKYGKKLLLLITLFIGLSTNILMGIVTKFQSIIIIRLIFYLTNQTQTLCKAFVPDIEVKEKLNAVYSTMSLLGVLGFVVGPIIGGYLFDMENGFYYISLITFMLTQVSIMFALLLPRDIKSADKKYTSNFAEKIAESLETSFSSLKGLELRSHWSIIFMKILITISLTVFFTKFSLLLKTLHKKSNTAVGYTVAYQSMLIFLSSFLVPLSEKIYEGQYIKKLLHSLSLLTISIANICYAPSYMMYLICFAPLGAAKCILDSAWHNVNSSIKTSNKSLENMSTALDTVTTMTSIMTPVVFGYSCDFYTHNAVKGFSIIPLALAMFMLHFSSKKQFEKLKLN